MSTDSLAFRGTWVQKPGGVRIPAEEPRVSGRPAKPIEHEWDEERLLAAHRAYNAGERDSWTCEGERVYNTGRKHARDAIGRMSAEGMEWCEKQAGIGLRLQWERSNRRGGNDELQRQLERLVA